MNYHFHHLLLNDRFDDHGSLGSRLCGLARNEHHLDTTEVSHGRDLLKSIEIVQKEWMRFGGSVGHDGR